MPGTGLEVPKGPRRPGRLGPGGRVVRGADTATGLGGPAVEADQGDQVALDYGDVVADERQRVVDLVGHAGDELPEAGELLGLDRPALRRLERLVRLMLGMQSERASRKR